MIERMQCIYSNLASSQGICWETITIRHGPFIDYVQKGSALVRDLRERGDNSGWTEIVEQHLFRSRMVPISWDEAWLTPLFIREPPNGSPSMRAFLEAAKRLSKSYREYPHFSILGCLSEQMAVLHKERRSFRVIVPRKHYKQDWLDFLGSCPCMNTHDSQYVENHLINAEQLHSCFQSVNCVIYAGMIWERLAGSLHQIVTAPRWEKVLHVRMYGTMIHPSFPDFPTTMPWKKKVTHNGLCQNLSGQENCEWTGLVRLNHKEITLEGPEVPCSFDADDSVESIPNASIPLEDWEVNETERAAHYSGKAFAVTTRSRHVLYQPLYNDGSRGAVAFLSPQRRQPTRTSHLLPGMLILITTRLKRRPVRAGEADAGLWKQTLRDRIRQKGEKKVTGDLRGEIQLRNLRQALRRWTRRSLLDAPRSRNHFMALWAYLGLAKNQQPEAWKAIRLERRNATRRGQDWAIRKNKQIRKVLADRLGKSSDFAALAQENGGQVVYKDDRIRVFLSKVESVASKPMERPFTRCNLAYRLREE